MSLRTDLRRVFFNPPKGGNSTGVQTMSSMGPVPSAPGPQTSLRVSMDAGTTASRSNATQSHVVGQYDFRNFERSKAIPAMDNFDYYDYERQQVASAEVRGAERDDTHNGIPIPSLRPDTHFTVRSDGKPPVFMPANPSDSTADGIDKNGGI